MLATEAPVGTFDPFAFQDQRVRRAALRASAAATAAVRGEQDFPHEEPADQDIENRKERNIINNGQGPEEFVEIVRRQPDRAFSEEPVEISFRFAAGPGDDPVGMPDGERRMDRRHVHRHVKAHRPFWTIAFPEQDQRREKGGQNRSPRDEDRPDVETSSRRKAEKSCRSFPWHPENKLDDGPRGQTPVRRKSDGNELRGGGGDLGLRVRQVRRNQGCRDVSCLAGRAKPVSDAIGIPGPGSEIDRGLFKISMDCLLRSSWGIVNCDPKSCQAKSGIPQGN